MALPPGRRHGFEGGGGVQAPPAPMVAPPLAATAGHDVSNRRETGGFGQTQRQFAHSTVFTLYNRLYNRL